jgi:hypothetical protein
VGWRREPGCDEEKGTMISKENVTACAFLVCLALAAVLAGEWMTRPADMDLRGSIVAVVVIYIILAGAPQIFIFAAAVSSTRQGRVPGSWWWSAAYLVFVLQFGAGATLVVGASTGEEGLFTVAAWLLVVAALVAVASGLVASRVGHKESAGTERS